MIGVLKEELLSLLKLEETRAAQRTLAFEEILFERVDTSFEKRKAWEAEIFAKVWAFQECSTITYLFGASFVKRW